MTIYFVHVAKSFFAVSFINIDWLCDKAVNETLFEPKLNHKYVTRLSFNLLVIFKI